MRRAFLNSDASLLSVIAASARTASQAVVMNKID